MLMVPICFLFIKHAYNQLRRVMKGQPPPPLSSISFSVCSSVSVLFFFVFVFVFLLITHYVMINNLLILLQ